MLESDAKVTRLLAAVERRPLLPLKRLDNVAIDLLQHMPVPQPNSQSIIAARMRLASERSKLVANRLEVARELALLNDARDEVEDYLSAKYRNYLDSIKNQTNRKALINRALQPLVKRIAALKRSLAVVNQVLEDFDSKAFAINGIVEGIKLGQRE